MEMKPGEHLEETIRQADYDACFLFNICERVQSEHDTPELGGKLITIVTDIVQTGDFGVLRVASAWESRGVLAVVMTKLESLDDVDFPKKMKSLQEILIGKFKGIADDISLSLNGRFYESGEVKEVDLAIDPVFRIEATYDKEIWQDFLKNESVRQEHEGAIGKVLSSPRFASYIEKFNSYWGESLKLTVDVFVYDDVDFKDVFYASYPLAWTLESIQLSGQEIALVDAYVIQRFIEIPNVSETTLIPH